jgi:hypothetical protein
VPIPKGNISNKPKLQQEWREVTEGKIKWNSRAHSLKAVRTANYAINKPKQSIASATLMQRTQKYQLQRCL